MLGLAERFGGQLEHFAVWVLITGGQESFGLGMKAFLKKHKADLDKERTVFINVDEVGAGTVRYGQREGVLLPGKSHPQLFQIAEQIAEDDGEDGDFGAKPLIMRTPTDGSIARSAGYPGDHDRLPQRRRLRPPPPSEERRDRQPRRRSRWSAPPASARS